MVHHAICFVPRACVDRQRVDPKAVEAASPSMATTSPSEVRVDMPRREGAHESLRAAAAAAEVADNLYFELSVRCGCSMKSVVLLTISEVGFGAVVDVPDFPVTGTCVCP